MHKLRGYLWFSLICLSIFSIWPIVSLSMVLFLVPFRPILSLKKRFVYAFSGYIIDFWAALLMYLGGTKVYVYAKNDSILSSGGNIIICNHRTRVDWMYAGWCFNLFTKNGNRKNHVILKDDLRTIPIFGWIMQLLMYTFLTRNRDKDVPHIGRSVRTMRSCDENANILIFPEGTDMSDTNIARNDEFAAKNNLAKLKNVLYPKSLGLLTCLSNWKSDNKSLIDITILYKEWQDGRRPSEVELIIGHFPREIYLFCDQYKFSEVPSTDSKTLTAWLYDIFLKKEKRIDDFKAIMASSNNNAETSAASKAVDRFKDKFEGRTLIAASHDVNGESINGPSTLFILFLVLSVLSFCYFIIYLLRTYVLFRYYFLAVSILALLGTALGGLDTLELSLLDRSAGSGGKDE